jgi:hypothetical protein
LGTVNEFANGDHGSTQILTISADHRLAVSKRQAAATSSLLHPGNSKPVRIAMVMMVMMRANTPPVSAR